MIFHNKLFPIFAPGNLTYVCIMKRLLMFFYVLCLLVAPTLADIQHLLPRPQKLTVLEDEAAVAFSEENIDITMMRSIPGASDYKLAGFENEAYRLTVREGRIKIEAVTATGVIRARQTLAQLADYEPSAPIPACIITDWPAFKLRGFMHDVGRSFVSFEELRHEIEMYARFKVNVFHFHLTENQAWRFEVKAYPQLTSASSMTRFPGKYYTQEQCRELDSVATANGVIIIPEVDMPGHSEAFTRAMGHGMQTDEGVQELQVILGEVAEAFPHSPYIHIGADEQRITYPDFLQKMIARVHELGRLVVVWNPIAGVTITKDLGIDMTQMWSTAGKKIDGVPNIDCRYNYTNHFDVFGDLAGIYRSNIYYAQRGNSELAGEISCPWNDRLLPTETDIIRQNNTWANTLASAERAWCGGGQQYVETGGAKLPNMGAELAEFRDWEERFLYHKARSLKDEPIPYVRQGNVRWLITQAFPNEGNAAIVLPPETQGPQDSYTLDGVTYKTQKATGAGIYLRHTWGTTVPAHFANPQLNTTAYAWTYVYSPVEQTAGALIEFQNYGRSEKDTAPQNGKWDRKGSRILLNDEEIAPPRWDNAGRSINNEVPLGNENMTARPPVQVQLRQGWNKVFLKLPYIAASGVRLNKWLFTFVLTDTEGKNALDDIVYSPTQDMNEKEEQQEETLTVRVAGTDNNTSPAQYGRWTTSNAGWKKGWVSGDASGLAGLQLGGQGASFDQSYDIYSRYVLTIRPSAAGATDIVTLTAPEGYMIAGYQLEARLFTAHEPYILTAGSVSITPTTTSWSTFAVDDLNAPETSFQLQATGTTNNRYLCVSNFTITLKPMATAISTTPVTTHSSSIYDLSGRRLASAAALNGNLPKGIYIVGNHKVAY